MRFWISSAYSPRPLRHAPVSTPVTWDELDDVDPVELTVRTVPDLVRRRGDPWEGMDAAVGSLDDALALWQADLERGLPELAFPPDYPKMPGEPPRVQPSRARRPVGETNA